MNKTENNLLVIQLSQVEIPKIVENTRNEWINFGIDNNYPQYLIDLFQHSSLHSAICKSKVNDICGSGVSYDGEDEKTNKFISQANPYETLNDVLKKIAFDHIIFGGYAINIIWSKDRKSIAEIYQVDYSNIRSGKMNVNKIVEEYYYSDDWSNRKIKPVRIPAFNPSLAGKEPSQLIYYKSYSPGMKYYSLPSYVGALNAIETDVEIANFHLAHIKNGMTPNLLINFNNGIPTEEERTKIERQIKDKYTGTDNAGRFIVTFSDDKDKAPVIETLSVSDLDKQFIQLQDTILQNILSGHSIVSPLLVGIPTSVGLGGTEIIQDSWQLYNNRVITPFKDEILISLNKIANINSLKELYINTSSPIEFSYSEQTLLQILTKNEMRERIGYEPIIESIETQVSENIDNK